MKPRRSKRRAASRPRKRKPTLYLLRGDEITFEDITEMFRALTGREPTPEEIEEAQAEWNQGDQQEALDEPPL